MPSQSSFLDRSGGTEELRVRFVIESVSPRTLWLIRYIMRAKTVTCSYGIGALLAGKYLNLLLSALSPQAVVQTVALPW